jgi:hypothetical protein
MERRNNNSSEAACRELSPTSLSFQSRANELRRVPVVVTGSGAVRFVVSPDCERASFRVWKHVVFMAKKREERQNERAHVDYSKHSMCSPHHHSLLSPCLSRRQRRH